MQAQFKFSYSVPGEDNSVNRIAREGHFIITSENGDDWVAKMEKINDSYVEFSEALQITLNSSGTDDKKSDTANSESTKDKK